MTSYSHSRLGTFQQCRYKYKLQYIDKVKVDVSRLRLSWVHKALEKLYKDLQFQKLNTKEELLDFFENEWEKTWDDNVLIAKEECTKEMGKKFIFDYYDSYKQFNSLRTIGLETEDKAGFIELLKEKGVYGEGSMISYPKLNSMILKKQIDPEVIEKTKTEKDYSPSLTVN
jgi:hypothetical protein